MADFFITATGTDIGKTYLASNLLRSWRLKGRIVAGLKPVLSGFDDGAPESSDAGELLAAMGRGVSPENLDQISPWRFKAPLSPDMAAAREGRQVVLDDVIRACRSFLKLPADHRLVEGVGGVMVPLNAHHTILDLMSALKLPTLLVTGSYLGTLSHTLTALSVLERAGVPLAMIVVNETPGSSVDLDETVDSLSRFWGTVAIEPLRRDPVSASIAAIADQLDLFCQAFSMR